MPDPVPTHTPAHDLARSRGFLLVEDVNTIMRCVQRLSKMHDPLIVDLGAGSGTTAGAVLIAGENAHVVTYDVSEDALYWAGMFLRNIGHDKNWLGRLKDSVEAAQDFPDETVDMLLIDTSHEYDQTVAEIDAWLPKLARAGVIWLHDYKGAYPGVTRAVDEAVAAGKIRLWFNATGLGWAGRKVG